MHRIKKMGNLWTDKEIGQLRKHYASNSIEELVEILGRGKYGIIIKLRKLRKEDPENWDIERIRSMHLKLHHDYLNARSRGEIKNNLYLPQEIQVLKANYRNKSLDELAEMLGRGKSGIVARLEKLRKEDPKNWDTERIKSWRNQLARERKKKLYPHRISNFWTEEEIIKLNENYLNKSIDELSEMLGRSKSGIFGKLLKLSKQDKREWNKKRITYFNAERMREYFRSRPEKLEEYKRRQRERDQKRKIARQGSPEWTDRDIAILANTCFTRSYEELDKIFAYKKEKFHTKLRELYEQDKDAWDIDTIKELENEYKKTKRRPEIDELIEQGLNQVEIAEQMGITRQAVSEYVGTRDLRAWYRGIQKDKIRNEQQRKNLLGNIVSTLLLAKAKKEDIAFYHAYLYTLKNKSANFEKTYQRTKDICNGYTQSECAARWSCAKASVSAFLQRIRMREIYHKVQRTKTK